MRRLVVLCGRDTEVTECSLRFRRLLGGGCRLLLRAGLLCPAPSRPTASASCIQCVHRRVWPARELQQNTCGTCRSRHVGRPLDALSATSRPYGAPYYGPTALVYGRAVALSFQILHTGPVGRNLGVHHCLELQKCENVQANTRQKPPCVTV